MNKTFDQGRDEVARLCQYFATNRAGFFAPGVKEAHVRQSLIDPLFEALGWEVANRQRVAPQYREVIPEDSLDVEGQQKAPDYTFRVGQTAKFFAEAKKCGVNVHADPSPAYQLRRYGWNAIAPRRTVLGLMVSKHAKSAPTLAAWLETNLPEGLAVFDVPAEHRRKLRTNNGLERLNRELKRRTRVVGIFPNEASLLRLATALLMEIDDEWQTGKRYLPKATP